MGEYVGCVVGKKVRADTSLERPVRGWLVALGGVHRGEDFRLGEGENLIGSAFTADIALTGIGISGSHAMLTCDSARAELKDLASRSGTKLNGERTETGELVDGDELIIGDVRLLFRLAKRFTTGYRPQLRARPVVNEPPSTLQRPYITGWLVQADGAGAGRDFRLLGGDNLIGHGSAQRGDANVVRLSYSGVAPRHAVVTCLNNQCTIQPATPAQTVLVNGVVIAGKTALRDSDAVKIGSVELYLKWF